MESDILTPTKSGNHVKKGLFLPEVQWAKIYSFSAAEAQWHGYNESFFKSTPHFRIR